MASFAPVYRPTKHQQTFLNRERKRESRKRKREDETDPGDATPIKSSPDPDDTPRAAASSTHHVSVTDPYYVAGLSREEPLPRYPFPHASAAPLVHGKVSVQEALANVKPPLYAAKTDPEDQTASLKRRHLDNLTAILQQCILKGNWQRASRTWGLLLRTEIAGRGIDVRQHGRWGIGAEILMRREKFERQKPSDRDSDPGRSEADCDAGALKEEVFLADEGFKLARDYYERLVLQYPHTPSTRHTLNATVFYPALFNIWVYEVQARYKRLRKGLVSQRPPSSHGDVSDIDSEQSQAVNWAEDQALSEHELEDAVAVAQRMDELLLNPPYDSSTPLLHLRGMVGLWLSDLYKAQAQPRSRSSDASLTSPGASGNERYSNRVAASKHKQHAREERERARQLFVKVKAAGFDGLSEGVPEVSVEDAMFD